MLWYGLSEIFDCLPYESKSSIFTATDPIVNDLCRICWFICVFQIIVILSLRLYSKDKEYLKMYNNGFVLIFIYVHRSVNVTGTKPFFVHWHCYCCWYGFLKTFRLQQGTVYMATIESTLKQLHWKTYQLLIAGQLVPKTIRT